MNDDFKNKEKFMKQLKEPMFEKRLKKQRSYDMLLYR